MRQFNVSGMSCSACSARVEKAVSKLEGVDKCSVSLLTNSMIVEGKATDGEIIVAVEKAGYKASIKVEMIRKSDYIAVEGECSTAIIRNNAKEHQDDLEEQTKKEMQEIRNRIVSSAVFLAILIYISMGYSMWGWYVPSFINRSPMTAPIIQLYLTTIVLVINQKFFINGYRSLIHGAPNMDTLVALGSSAAYIYSSVILFLLGDAVSRGEELYIHKYMHEFYFESAAMIVTLISVGKLLEAKSKGKTTSAIKSLMNLAPKMATVIRDKEVKVNIDEVKVGDIYVVKPGEYIPVDGMIIEGATSVDESALTGESIPIDKKEGAYVSAATINGEGFIKCKATRVGGDTTLAQIIRVVSEAVATKAPIAKVADKVSGVFVPIVIIIAIITIIVWLALGETIGYALARGISVLVISCPCALGLATPVAIMVGSGVGAKHGIMFKSAEALEVAGKADVVALDKTGTITKGTPVVTDIKVAEGIEESELLMVAYSLEKKSEHPLAKAVISYVEERYGEDDNLKSVYRDVERFKSVSGKGLSGYLDGEAIYGGKYDYIKELLCEKYSEDELSICINKDIGTNINTMLYFAKGSKVLGVFAVADAIKKDSKEAIRDLKELGMRVVMITGDNQATADAIAREACVDEVIADVLPTDKATTVKTLQENGTRVIMVGDGINDAPALVQADVGIAIGAGADVAIESADVILMKSNLTDLVAAIRLSKSTLKNIHQNLFWAFFYNIIGIPLAAGVWIPLFGWELNPMFGALAMSLSSFCVVSNALRLNWCPIYKNLNVEVNEDKNQNNIYMEELEMKKEIKKVMNIEGMMCGHCEARVKKVLEGIEGVKEAIVNHEKDEAIVIMEKEITDELLKTTIEGEDYKVIDIK